MTADRLGAFETIREVGSGGMGSVWEARHVETGVPVAVKFLAAERARNPRWLANFQIEARAVARLGHPRVVRLYDIGFTDADPAIPYLVMEWAPQSLEDLLAQGGGRLRWPAVRGVLLEVLDALAHVHARGIVHRDIKPANVLGRPGRLRLGDFGIARLDAAAEEGLSGGSGTPYFMAPEQFTWTAGPTGPWTDLYAVGCLAYYLLTGQPPFAGGSLVALASQHLSIPFPLEHFAPAFQAWLGRMTAKSPFARYRFAARAAHDLVQVASAFDEAPVDAPAGWFGADTDTPTWPLATLILDAPVGAAAGDADPRSPAPGAAVTAIGDWRGAHEARPHVEHAGSAGLSLSAMRVGALIGREDEQDRLWATFRSSSAAGRPTLSWVMGERGVGRSRLAAWLGERAHELGAAAYLGPVSCRTSDDAILSMLRVEFGAPSGDAGLIEDRVARRAAAAELSELERHAIIGALSGVAATPRERYSALTAALRLAANDEPLVVIVDDVDAAAGEELDALAHALAVMPNLHVVATSCSAPPDRLAASCVVTLAPLSGEHIGRLVSDLAPLHPDTVAALVAGAAGNPGRATELVRALVERGELRAGPVGYELARSAKLPALRSEGAWAERMARLGAAAGPAAEQALELAAVLGGVVADDEWARLARATDTAIPPGLADALDVRGDAHRRPGGWSFADPEFRAWLVARSKERGTWRAHVAAARDALVDATPDRRAGWELELGHARAAARQFLEAARAANRAHQISRATQLLSHAESAIAQITPEEAIREQAEADALKAALWGLDRLAEADGVAQSAEQAARAHAWDDLLGEVLERRARFARKRVELTRAEALYAESLDAFRRCGDERQAGSALQGLGMVAVSRGELDAAERYFSEAQAVSSAQGDLGTAAWCANGLGDVHRKLDRFDLARQSYARALAWFEQVGNGYGAMWCVHDLGLVERSLGDLDRAAERLGESVRLAAGLGQRVVAPRLNLGVVHVLRGDYARARLPFEEVREECVLRAIPGEEAIARACLLPCDAHAGRWREVRDHLTFAATNIGDLVDGDLGRMARVASTLADDAGEHELAGELGAFAARHGQ